MMTNEDFPFQIHIPFFLLRGGFLAEVIKRRLNPEIAFNHAALDETGRDDFLEVASRIAEAGLSVTFHAPFLELRPGAFDPKIRRVTVDRLRQVFDLVPYFRPQTVVCHPSFDAKYYPGAEDEWLKNSLDTWRSFAALAEDLDTVIVLENVYEKSPRELIRLLTALDSKRVRFCFDTGHFNVFARKPLEDWLRVLGPFLRQLHLHDNQGEVDSHLPIGEGNFPFPRLMDHLAREKIRPLVTLEVHAKEQLALAVLRYEAIMEGAARGRSEEDETAAGSSVSSGS